MKIPHEWKSLRPGEQIPTTIPLHRIELIIRQMSLDGWEMRTEPCRRGYWIICDKAPHIESSTPALGM